MYNIPCHSIIPSQLNSVKSKTIPQSVWFYTPQTSSLLSILTVPLQFCVLLASLSPLVAWGSTCSPIRLYRWSSTSRMAHPYTQSQEGLLCLPAQSQEPGRDSRKLVITWGELDRAIEGHQPSSGTGICSFVQGKTRRVLSEPYRMTLSRLLVCMFMTKLSETDSMRTSSSTTCANNTAPCGSIGIRERTTRVGRSAIGTPFSFQVRSGSHWARATGMKVWRCCGEHNTACNIIQQDRFGDGPVMVWRDVLGGWHRPPCHSQSYPVPIVRSGFLLQDNACPHVDRVRMQLLDEQSINAIDWPFCSPDLNLIEQLWDVMHQCIRCRRVPPQTVKELSDPLIKVWGEIPQDTIRWLIRSRPICFLGLVQVRGGLTNYWITLWVGSVCDFNFLLRFLVRFWIQPSVGWGLGKASNLNNSFIEIWCVFKVYS